MELVSAFGRYAGHSEARYDSVVRESRYVAMRDGVKVAVDIFRPAVGGVVETKPLPVVLTVTRYWRARVTDTGHVMTSLGNLAPGANTLPLNIEPIGFNEPARMLVNPVLAAHGYVFVVFENRGTGASFGRMGQHGDEQAGVFRSMLAGIELDLYDMVQWCAGQPWSTGRVGMTGGSWLGSTQLFAAAAHPPALEAITPNVPSAFHSHRISHFGGVFFKGAMVTMGKTMIELARNDGGTVHRGVRVVGPSPVDEDPDGELCRAARAGHGEASWAPYFSTTLDSPAAVQVFTELGMTDPAEKIDTFFSQERLASVLRDRPDTRRALDAIQFYDAPAGAAAAANLMKAISTSRVPCYFWDGWRDAHPHDRLVMFNNHGAPKRIAMGPWGHGPINPFDQREKEAMNLLAVESLRWLDRWVRDVDNGVDREDPVAYAVTQPGPTWTWRHAASWPPPECKPIPYSFGSNGTATASGPAEDGSDSFVVDYSANSGEATVYASVAGGPACEYPDMRANDAKGLSYTTEPLSAPVTVAGSPVFRFVATADQRDALLVVHVEEVLADGRSELLKQGFLRASHRALRDLPYDNMGVPFMSSLPDDVAKTPSLTDGPAKVVVATEPFAHTFQAGSRIRFTITGNDESVIWAVPQDPPPTITIVRGSSLVELPVLAT